MTVKEQNAFLKKEYAEAIRYMDNAEEVLAKARKDGSVYKDKKYVRMACGTAYSGILVALDAWLAAKGVPEPPKKQRRKSIDFYMSNIAKLDKKLLSIMDAAYKSLHLSGYYDGMTGVKSIAGGFDLAYEIIDKIKPAY